MSEDSLNDLNRRLKAFAQGRNWEQFHNPKNLSMAMIAECAELVEHFQWMTPEQSMNLTGEKLEQVTLELADILIYLLRLGERLPEPERREPGDRLFAVVERCGPGAGRLAGLVTLAGHQHHLARDLDLSLGIALVGDLHLAGVGADLDVQVVLLEEERVGGVAGGEGEDEGEDRWGGGR